MSSWCAKCKQSERQATLNYCRHCAAVLYCSNHCQSGDWLEHRKVCGKPLHDPHTRLAAGQIKPRTKPYAEISVSSTTFRSITPSPPRGLTGPVTQPFTRLDSGTWLDDRPDIDVYRLLVDVFRLHLRDKLDFDNVVHVDDDGVSAGAEGKLRVFQEFLEVAEHRRVLPRWWTFVKANTCSDLAMDRRQWHNLHHPLLADDVSEHYGDKQFPLQLRMFAEAVTGRGPGGHIGTNLRKSLVAEESSAVEGDDTPEATSSSP